MNINFIEHQGILIAELISDTIEITTTPEALDIMADCSYNKVYRIIFHEENITPAFFDLKTGIAGDILQKFSTYRMQLAIVGDFSKYTSQSLKDFIYESNKGRQVIFVNTLEEALERLGK